jgi:hypothetical protein
MQVNSLYAGREGNLLAGDARINSFGGCGDPHKLVGIAFYLSGITPDSKGIPVATKNNRTKTTEFAWLHLTISPELKAALKARALAERKTQTALVIQALEQYLAEGKS